MKNECLIWKHVWFSVISRVEGETTIVSTSILLHLKKKYVIYFLVYHEQGHKVVPGWRCEEHQDISFDTAHENKYLNHFSVSVYYVAVRTIVLSRHGSNLASLFSYMISFIVLVLNHLYNHLPWCNIIFFKRSFCQNVTPGVGMLPLTLKALKYLCISHRDQRVIFNLERSCLSQLFPLHLNTYVYVGLQPL